MAHPTQETQDLATAPVTGLFVRTAIPIVISLMVAGLYNVIDTIYIARGLGADAMGGVSMVFPLQMLIAACASMISTGAASLMARQIGAGNPQAASDIAGAALNFSLLIALVFTLAGIFLTPWILSLLNVSQELVGYSVAYTQPILIGSVVAMLIPLLGNTLRSEGKIKAMMVMILLASILNIVLDPVFIFTLDMGVKGAAVATVVAQGLAIVYGLSLYVKKTTLIRFKWHGSFGTKYWLLLVGLGMPIFVSQLSMGVQAGYINYLLQELPGGVGDKWVSAYGILGRLFTFVILPLIGMLVAFQTICGFNYGAGQLFRVKQSIHSALAVMSLYAILLAATILLFPDQINGLFTQNNELLSLARHIILMTLWTFPLAGIMIVATGYYQATGKVAPAIIYSGLRVFIILVPLLFILPEIWGELGIFLSIPIADVIAVMLVVMFCSRDYRWLSRTASP